MPFAVSGRWPPTPSPAPPPLRPRGSPGARRQREVRGAVGGGDGDEDHRGHVAPARQELSDAGGVVEVGVTVEQVHHGVLLLASLVALRQVDDELPVLSQHVRVKLPGGSDDVG